VLIVTYRNGRSKAGNRERTDVRSNPDIVRYRYSRRKPRKGKRTDAGVDGDGELLRRLRVLPQAAIPSTLLLDRHGRIADRVIGPVTGAQIRALVTALLNES